MIDDAFRKIIEEFIELDSDIDTGNYINKKNNQEKLELVREAPHTIRWIKSSTEEIQIEAVKSLNYKYNDDGFVSKFITYPKALNLYDKLKRVRNIIK